MLRATFAVLAATAASAAPGINIWPLPQSYSAGSATGYLGPLLSLTCAAGSPCPDPLPAALSRYTSMLTFAGAPAQPSSGNVITGLTVTIANGSVPLGLGVNESYTLNVPASGVATLVADNAWGALRGLESFSQIFEWAGRQGPTTYASAVGLPLSIVDAPRFVWRGVLIDSSRHYLSLAAIKATLDAMAFNKLNVLHWHVVDDNSWPLQSLSYPNFTVGAYAPDAIYTHADVSELVQYAFERGIRIIPEFDGPAHADAWGKGYPDLVIACSNGQTLLDPTDEGGVYDVVRGLLAEFTPLFGNDVIHFGGDEVQDLTCWNESAKVQAFMASKGIPDVNALRNYFESQLQSIAASFGLDSMFWEEVYDDGYTVLPSSIVDIWLSYDEVESAVKSGHRVVSSFGLYLDQQVPFGSQHYFWQDTWQNFFLNDPTFNRSLTPAEEALILGESLSQWGEQVDSASIQTRMWPRACGGAERMWTSASYRNVSEAEGRLEHMRCHMLQRGIAAGPIRPASEYVYCPMPDASRF